jgi:hypothetical protein
MDSLDYEQVVVGGKYTYRFSFVQHVGVCTKASRGNPFYSQDLTCYNLLFERQTPDENGDRSDGYSFSTLKTKGTTFRDYIKLRYAI